MRAVTVPRFGDADVLVVGEVSTPEPASGQVAIEVTHAAVGLADVLMRRGEFGGTTPLIPGLEVAGTVRSVGAGVSGLEPGRPVVTLSRPTAGGYAEVSIADAAITFPIDDPGATLDPALAVAGVPNTTTALIVLERVAHLRQGERVLVHGAAGGLAAMVGQVAKALGAGQVIGSVRSDEAAAAARRHGFDTIVDGRRLIASLKEHDVDPVDVVVDPVGGELRAQSMGLLAPLGRLIAVGNASGAGDVMIGANDAWLTNRAVLGLNIGGLLMAHPTFADEAARRAIQLLSAGDVTIDHVTMPLDQAAEAHRRLEAGGLTSRILLAP
ncbi:quinone oxidoreductase family protein [Solicola gregarius]|uniref:Zinc-binding dehydrogenase n=1 Tax=Solicola gregarius TaxID=2908642 RepID=A0AA46TLP2_9ACTN|nr:zinc-binding dehydrogenase [Solicola gregarius]UYM07614.1 zinc-binding dehydrogenase [Solicola gregarius]